MRRIAKGQLITRRVGEPTMRRPKGDVRIHIVIESDDGNGNMRYTLTERQARAVLEACEHAGVFDTSTPARHI